MTTTITIMEEAIFLNVDPEDVLEAHDREAFVLTAPEGVLWDDDRS